MQPDFAVIRVAIGGPIWLAGAVLFWALALWLLAQRVALWPRLWPKAGRGWPGPDRGTLGFGALLAVPLLALSPLLPLAPGQGALLAGFALLGAAAAGQDRRSGLLPDAETLGLAACGALFAATRPGGLLAGVIAALVAAALLAGLNRVWRASGRGPAALGQGDVKLAAALGLWVGPAGLGPMLALAALAGLAVAAAVPGLRKLRFGGFLIGAGWAVTLALALDLGPGLA